MKKTKTTEAKKAKEPTKFSVFELTPKLIVRAIFFLMISPLVYKETGIWTTILLGILYLEVAVKTDWMQSLHTLQMTTVGTVKDVVEFQNRFFNKLQEKKNESRNS